MTNWHRRDSWDGETVLFAAFLVAMAVALVIFVCTVVPASAFAGSGSFDLLTEEEMREKIDFYAEIREFFDDRILSLENLLKRRRLDMPRVTPLECGLERTTPLSALIATYIRPDGSEAFVFDTNGDGEKDAVLIVPDDGNKYPSYYLFDREPFDRLPDIVYYDKKRDGTCTGIEWEKPTGEKSSGHSGTVPKCTTEDCDKRKEGEL